MKNRQPIWQHTMEMLARVDIMLCGRIIRRMIYYLYTHNVRQITDLISQLYEYNEGDKGGADQNNDNVPLPKIDPDSLREFATNVFRIAGENLKDEEIQSQIEKWIGQEKSLSLSITAEKSNVSLAEIRDAIEQHFNLPQQNRFISNDDLIGIIVSLVHRFMSDSLPFIKIAKQYLNLADFASIVRNTIGTPTGSGKLGGKSAALILAYRIVEKSRELYPELEPVRIPQSWFITSDTNIDFIHFNALEEVVSLKYMPIEEIRAGFPYLLHLFKNSCFPSDIVAQLGTIIDKVTDKPLVVRSSSLLENGYDAAFAGKYRSFFISNKGTRFQRMNALLDAISEVYASIFSPDPIEYRKEHGLLDFQEGMGVLIQEVVGNQVGDHFFPTMSGVALSNNEFPWSPRISRGDGVARMVAGLGTRAVDRLGDDYSFLMAPARPDIRINVTAESMIQYSQRCMDVINIDKGKFETVEVDSLVRTYGTQIPGIEKILSIDRDGILFSPIGAVWDYKHTSGYVTFQGMAEQRTVFKLIHRLLEVLQERMGCPVDIEFAWDGNYLYLLQCRAQYSGGEEKKIDIPEDIPCEKLLFSSRKYIVNAALRNIQYVVFVDPQEYCSLPSVTAMRDVASAIFYLNRILPARKFILIGPGRWGSRGDIRLGVPVTYSDINNTAMLVEIGLKQGDDTQVSFGTHFFQDLVESGIKYLPLFPLEQHTLFCRELLDNSPNEFVRLVPDLKYLQSVIHVTDTTKVTENGHLQIIMDHLSSKAIAYLTNGQVG